MGLGEISLGEMGLGEMGLGEMGQNQWNRGEVIIRANLIFLETRIIDLHFAADCNSDLFSCLY